MRLDFFQIIFLLSSFLGTVGLLITVYSRNIETRKSKLFIIILLLILIYLVSHTFHFVIFNATNVTILDLSCHSLLLTILVALSFFTLNFPKPVKFDIVRSTIIFIPSIFLLILLWSGDLIQESHSHSTQFTAHYSGLYPLFLFWYLFLIGLNLYWASKNYAKEKDKPVKKQILLYAAGLVTTNLITFIFGLYLPWQLGFYYLVEMSPLAFFIGLILFTAVAIGKYDMFSVSLGRVHNLSLNKKIILSALIVVPIIILLIQMPLIKLLFKIGSDAQSIHYLLLSILGGIIVSISISFIIIKIISNPVNKLITKVREIENGSYGTNLQLRSNDEIGELARAFNNMSAALKKNLEELRQKEERISILLNAFDKSAAAIAIVDGDFDIIDVNNKFSEMMVQSKEILKGSSIEKIQFKTQIERFNEIKNSLLSRHKFDGEMYYEDKVLLFSATSTTGKNGKIEGYLFVELDITEQKHLENQLLKSEKLAALGSMAAVLAHEIKTPLTSIKMNADMLSETYTQESESFEIIRTEINRLNNLVRDVLQFSRQMELDFSIIDLYVLVENVYTQLSESFRKKNITFINNTPEVEFNGDSSRLRQVFLNLISNSAEAIGKDGTVEVSAIVSENKNNIKLIFFDTGPGIKEPEKVFEPFFTTKSSGTGLGLAIARKIIEEHKGTIELTSFVHGNTVFEINLPYLAKKD